MPGDGNNGRPGDARREDSFLARWSRRKHQSEHGIPVEDDEAAESPEHADAPASDTADVDQAADAAHTDTTPDDAELPHPDTLDRDSDFSVYLTRRVSSAFRRAAMRRLFSSPEFNVRDGLDDYDEDYTQFQSLGNTVTAHMRHHAERLRRRDEEKTEQAARDAEADCERAATEDDPDREPETDATEHRQTEAGENPTAADRTPDPDDPESDATAHTQVNRDTDDTT